MICHFTILRRACLWLLGLALLATGCRPGGADAWGRIQMQGRLVVGTAADYAPFEFVAGDGRLDGFDVAVVEAIGRRLALQVEWRNVPFDSLLDALENGEVDLVVAAMEVTPERAARVDFTAPYFSAVDAVLVAPGAAPLPGSVADLDGLRVGVQRNTPHEAWADGNLSGGPATRYDHLGQAVADLQAGALDALLVDYYAALAYLRSGEAQLAFQPQLVDQAICIALPKGAVTLQETLNDAIAALRADGTLEQMAETYLSGEEPIPLP